MSLNGIKTVKKNNEFKVLSKEKISTVKERSNIIFTIVHLGKKGGGESWPLYEKWEKGEWVVGVRCLTLSSFGLEKNHSLI